jgi:hypothetical protein
MTDINNCPVRKEAESALQTGKSLMKALRRLHRSLKACRECPAGDDCPLKQSFSEQINEAVAEITAEWELE